MKNTMTVKMTADIGFDLEFTDIIKYDLIGEQDKCLLIEQERRKSYINWKNVIYFKLKEEEDK